jgi:glycosyltransferase involved in cell wall biosynthesis
MVIDGITNSEQKPVIVVSGVNLTEMGGLSVLRDCLRHLAERSDKYCIVALVHNRDLIDVPNVFYCEFPRSKRSILDRLHHEYWVFWKLSRRLNPLLWFSLHNTTPNVRARMRAVYCQNVSNLYKLDWRDALLQPRFAAVNTFLDFLYRINLRRNTFVVVQQEWVRQAFRERFGLDNIVVAHPVAQESQAAPLTRKHRSSPFIFFYPSHPSIHKNFEVVCDATKQLVRSGITDFEVWLTLSPSDNRYARQLSKRCGGLPQIRLLGRLPREEVFERYALTDCLLFPSKLETWGLPISEFRSHKRSMLIADAAYAREAVGDHPSVAFFLPDSVDQLTYFMKDAMQGARLFKASTGPMVESPFASSWTELFDILLDAEPKVAAQDCGQIVGDSFAHDATKSV